MTGQTSVNGTGAAASAAQEMRFARSRELQKKAHALIPGGAHTYAKGDDQYPEIAPGFIARGRGCHVWDVDGNEFIEYGMGLRSVALGHAYEPVIQAAYAQMLEGANFTRPAAIEVETAEQFLGLFPGADMVKFGKNGSDVTTAAVKLARAYTQRDKVAICADHPFFSVDDWFIGATEMSSGIPQDISRLTVRFRYNDLASLEQCFADNPGEIACVVMEAATSEEPRPGFLADAKSMCEKKGALLIFDEMITGFRWHIGGAQSFYGVTPHLSTFGKALGNGFAISALAGRRDVMELGGLRHDKARVFLLSTTHGAETHALAAAQATMTAYQKEHVIAVLEAQGIRLRRAVEASIAELQLEPYFQVLGRPCNLIYATRDAEGARSQGFRTLFLQELIRRGILAPSFVVSFAHSDADIDRTAEAVHESLIVYRKALREGLDQYLAGRPVKPVFRRYNG